MVIRKFEDILAWQEARVLVRLIYGLTKAGTISKDFEVKDQLRRASVSTMTNIAEGFDCDSDVEFARFLGIARRSAVEVQSLLYIALDEDYIDQPVFDVHYEQARKTKALIGGFKKSLLTKRSQQT